MNAADIIATCALLFTVGSFWLLTARAGKLQIIGEPRSYTFAASGQFYLILPLVFSNSRPLSAVAVNLRLRLDAPGFPLLVPFVATYDGVKPTDAGRRMATSIVIQGRETRLICCEFYSGPYDVLLAKSMNLPITVEAFILRKSRSPAWHPLLTFPLRLPEEAVKNRAHWVVYDNQVSPSN